MTFRHVRATIVMVEKLIISICSECVCVCVDLGMQHAMHMSYCHLWSALLFSIFPQCLINSTVFKKRKS